jgi:hypothetical protein
MVTPMSVRPVTHVEPDALEAAVHVLVERERAAVERVDAVRQQFDSASEELRSIRAAREHLERLIGGVGDTEPAHPDRNHAPTPPAGSPDAGQDAAPAGMEAVEIALKESPVPLTVRELTEAVRRLGWTPDTEYPERAVRAAGNRLRAKNRDFAYVSKHFIYRPRHIVERPGQTPFLRGEADDDA